MGRRKPSSKTLLDVLWVVLLGCLAVCHAAPTAAPTLSPEDQDLAEVTR